MHVLALALAAALSAEPEPSPPVPDKPAPEGRASLEADSPLVPWFVPRQASVGFFVSNVPTFYGRVGWEVAFYDIGLAGGTSAHLRAEQVRAGTWIDLHLSITRATATEADRDSLRRELLAALAAIGGEGKPAGAQRETSRTIGPARAAPSCGWTP